MMTLARTYDSPSDTPASPLTILLADDAVDIQAAMRGWLTEAGHTVIAVSCGNDAVRALRSQRIDAVITEVIMPNGDGLEVILEAKKSQPNARVIAMSAGGRYLPAADCLRVAQGLGAHAALPKPPSRPQLLATVEKLLANRAPASAAR